MYAVKINVANIEALTRYAGLHGETKSKLEKVSGWKKRESAEKFIENHKRIHNSDVVTYEIIEY